MISHRYEASGPFIVVAFLFGANLADAQTLTVDRVQWLQGCWQSVRGEATIEEHWMAPRGGTMLGMGRTVRGGKTVEYEMVLIKEQNDRLAYEAHPSGQPSATFLSATISDTTVVFENPEHDFPQRVGYRRDGTDGLQAWVEGQANGKSRRIDFAYQRSRCEH
ncbi:MAG TPA: DUF6265 family protein [Vicinamibacterales bacterium]|nr:DUF6265 family protein [Vicinamibacterales bacterium]